MATVDWRRGLAKVLVPAVLALGYLLWRNGGTRTRLADADRAPLVIVDEGNQRRLRHPTLGFSLLHPGPGFVASDSNAFGPSAQFYSFTDSEARVRLTVGLFKGKGGGPGSLRDLLEAMSKNTDALGGRAAHPPRVEKLEVSGDEPPRGTLEMVLGDGRHLRTNAHGWRAADGTPYAILMTVMAHSYAPGSAVLASFRP